MKFTDPVTRLFFFLEVVKAVRLDRWPDKKLSYLVAGVGTLDPECVSQNPIKMIEQAEDMCEHLYNNGAHPPWARSSEQ